jgi:HK97 gp10 family phage protein
MYKRNKNFDRKFQKLLRTRLLKAAFALEAAIKGALSQSTRALGPSSPGDAPHSDTGQLRQSIGSGRVTGIMNPSVDVGSVKGGGAPYAKFLEFGTAKMQARPFLRPSVKRLKRRIIQIIARG